MAVSIIAFLKLKAPGAVFSQIRECDDLMHESLTPPVFCLAASSVSMVSIKVRQAHICEREKI